ncbi:hypothetical protein IFR05_008863, partial [Cadophora sp. M221]
TLAPVAVSYSFASSNCPSEYTFAAPRTALENAYLTLAMRRSDRDFDGHGAWVDFNSLDVEGCWTTGGPNATCPYRETVGEENDLQKRVILPHGLRQVRREQEFQAAGEEEEYDDDGQEWVCL